MEIDTRTLRNIENGVSDIAHSKLERFAKELGTTVPLLETVHERQIININTPHDNHVVYNNGVIQAPEQKTIDKLVDELRHQLSKKRRATCSSRCQNYCP